MHRALLTLMLGVVVVAVGWSDAARAQCQIPLIISQGNGSLPKVLIILDSSGSMNEVVMSSAYNRSTNYSGRFNRTSMYDVDSDGTYSQRSFDNDWPSSPTAYLVDSDAGEDGQYPGNYLNWIYSHATSAQRAAIPTQTRIQAAKQGVTTLLSTVSSCSFGIMIFNGDEGGDLICPFGTSVATMTSSVNNIHADSWTPLAETLVDALDYFKSTGAGAPFADSCQKVFCVMVTDGMPTQDLDVPSYLRDYDGDGQDPGNCTSLGTGLPNSYDCSGYVNDVAAYLYREDLRSTLLGVQNVPVFVIGFDINNALLQSTASQGGGEYYTVTNVTEFVAALNAATNNIETRIGSGSSVSVVASEERLQNRMFRARYESNSWKGFVEAFQLPHGGGDPPLWEAGSQLVSRSPSTRRIFTSTNGTTMIDFNTTNVATLQAPLTAANATEAGNIIRYIRGDSIVGYRDREGWRLGDVVDAAPVAIGRPSGFNQFLAYSAFRAANSGRNEILVTGGNDGMMHAFDTDDGTELWGYVPKNQLPRVKKLTDPAYCHDYFVNMTPGAFDVHFGGSWKTIVVGGEERGGSGLFALNITDPDPDDIRLLWDVNIPALFGSWNTPTVVRDPVRNKHVLVVGSGLNAANAVANLVTIDPANGAVLSTLPLGAATIGNKCTEATAVDTDLNGYDDRLYLCDLAGRLWRVNLTTNPWTVTLLFNSGKPIQGSPVVTLNALGQPMIFFGTGRYLSGTDPGTTTQQTLFCVIDNGGAAVTLAQMVNQSTTINPVTSGHRGWYINLPILGERITRTASLVAGVLYVPSFKPNAATCGGLGQSWLYSVDYKDGSAPSNANGSENQTTAGRSAAMGDGILADPSIDLVNEDIILQSSNAVIITQNINVGLQRLVVRSWRQKLN